MLNNNFIRSNKLIVSILLFLLLFSLIQAIKPSFLYNNDGSLREFGVGYKNKTILPIWLLSLLLGILCYLAVLYYLAVPKMFD